MCHPQKECILPRASLLECSPSKARNFARHLWHRPIHQLHLNRTVCWLYFIGISCYIAPSIASVWRMPSSRAAFLIKTRLLYNVVSSLGATHCVFCGNNLTLRVYAWDFCYAHCRYARQHVFGAGLGNGPLYHRAKVFYRLLRHESSNFPRNVRLLYSWRQLTSASWINRKTALLQLLRDCTFLPIVLMQQLLAVPFVVVDNMC